MALLVVCDVLDALPHGAGAVFSEVGLYLLFVLCFSSLDTSIEVRPSLPVGLPVS